MKGKKGKERKKNGKVDDGQRLISFGGGGEGERKVCIAEDNVCFCNMVR